MTIQPFSCKMNLPQNTEHERVIALSYTHFTLSERKMLQEFLTEGKSFREIAAILGRAPSSVSREVKRNKAKYKPHRKTYNKYWYNYWRAEILYITRRKTQCRFALQPGTEPYEYIVEKLLLYWAPETIAKRWKLENPEKKPISQSTIYRYIQMNRFPKITVQTHLRRRGKLRYSHRATCNVIHPDRIIPEWPSEIVSRTRIGDWEGDTVYGGVGKGLIVTQVDRKSRYLQSKLLMKRDAKMTADVICEMLKDMPVTSMSLDNGAEFSEFRAIEERLKTQIYFAEPHKPWQRGTNENTNGLLRFFFPKGFDFRTITQDELDFVVNLINNRPRKCLGWKTPAEVFFKKSVALG